MDLVGVDPYGSLRNDQSPRPTVAAWPTHEPSLVCTTAVSGRSAWRPGNNRSTRRDHARRVGTPSQKFTQKSSGCCRCTLSRNAVGSPPDGTIGARECDHQGDRLVLDSGHVGQPGKSLHPRPPLGIADSVSPWAPGPCVATRSTQSLTSWVRTAAQSSSAAIVLVDRRHLRSARPRDPGRLSQISQAPFRGWPRRNAGSTRRSRCRSR